MACGKLKLVSSDIRKMWYVLWLLHFLVSVTSTMIKPCRHIFKDDKEILCKAVEISTLKRNEYPVNNSLTTRLEINYGNLKTIEYNALDDLSRLIYLNFNHNKLTQLDRRVFRQTRNIQQLYLAFNQIETLDGQIFSNLYQLTYLDIAINKLKILDDSKLFASQGASLIYLKLDYNNLEKISSKVLEPLEALSMLLLSNNPFNCSCELQDTIQWTEDKKLYTYAKCTTPGEYRNRFWTEFSVENCTKPWRDIRRIPVKICKYIERFSLINCKNLYLPNFPINEYPFNETDVLEIDMETNLITKLEQNTFDKWPEVKKLVLRSNKLRSLDKRQFIMLKELTYLDISENLLTYLDREQFQSQAKLKTLYLFSNSFSIISVEVFKPLVSLNRINMLDNPLSCDCLLWPSVVWSIQNDVFVEATCKEPKEVNGQSWNVLAHNVCTSSAEIEQQTETDAILIGASVGGCLFFILIVAVVCFCCCRKGSRVPRSETPPIYDDVMNRNSVNSCVYIHKRESSDYSYPTLTNPYSTGCRSPALPARIKVKNNEGRPFKVMM